MPATRMDLEIRCKNLATKALRDIERELSGLDRTSVTATRSMMGSFGRMAQNVGRHIFSLKTAIVGFIAVLGVRKLAGSFIEVAKYGESLRLRLNALLGSVKEGAELFKNLGKFAARVPFEYKEIMAAATQLAGIMRGGRTEIMKWMPLIADLAAATGLGIEQTTSQIMRMLSAGAAAADMFRERGVLAMLGFTAGVKYTAEETKKMLWKAWTDSGSMFRGLTGEMAKSWEGMISMLRDAWFQFRQKIMEARIFDYLKGGLKIILDWIDKVKKEGKLDEWAEKVGKTVISVFKGMSYAVAGTIDMFRIFHRTLWMIQKAWLELELTIGRWFGWMAKIDKFFGRFSKDCADAALELETMAERATKGLEEINKNLEGQKSAVVDVWLFWEKFEKQIEAARKAFEEAEKTGVPALRNIKEETKKVAKEFEVLSEKLAEYFRTPIEKLEYQRDEMYKVAQGDAELRLQIERWYTTELYKIIGERLKTQMDANLERAKNNKKTLDDMRKDDLAYWVRVTQNADNGTDEIEKAWMHVRRIVEEQNVGMIRGFKIGWDDAVAHFRTVGHRFYELGRDTAQKLHEVFSDYFFDAMMGNIRSLKDAWKSFCDYMKQAFLRAVADMAAAELTKAIFGSGDGKKEGSNIWDWLGAIGGIWDFFGSAWSWIKGLFHTGGPVKQTGLYSLEGGEYVVPRGQVAMFKGMFGTGNLDKVLGGRTSSSGRRSFQEGGEVPEERDDAWINKFLEYLQRIKGVKWVWDKILGPAMQYMGLITPSTAGMFGPYQMAGGGYMGGGMPGGTYSGYYGYGQTMGGLNKAWSAISPYLTVAGLGYLGGSILGSYIGPQWFGTTGQYGGYGGALGAVGGYALGTSGAVSGTALGAALGSWAGPIGAIIGGLLGTVLGSAIGPTAHKTKAGVAFNMSAEQLLKGTWPKLLVTVKSTHGSGYSSMAAGKAANEIWEKFYPALLEYRKKIRNMQYVEEFATMMPNFDLYELIPQLKGGRKKHVGQWINAASVAAPKALEEWWNYYGAMTLFKLAEKHPERYGPRPEMLLGGKHYGTMGYAPGTWQPVIGYMQEGGFIRRTGLYHLEAGEKVTPKEKSSEPINLNFSFDVKTVDARDFKRMISNEIMPEIEKKIRNYGYIRSLIKEV